MTRRGQIPIVRQNRSIDCGAACLAMVLRRWGRPVTLDEVCQTMGIGRDGANALTIIQVARQYGLEGQGLRVELEGVSELEPGSILHWEFRHFVVLERVTRSGVRIVDPATGRRRVTIDQFRRSFTGVALTFAPGPDFKPVNRHSQPLWLRHTREILTAPGLLAQVLVTSLLLQALALGVPILTGAIVDQVLPYQDVTLLWVLAAGLLTMTLFHLVATLVRSNILAYLRSLLDGRMTRQFMEHLIRLPFAFFQARSDGDLIARVNSNAVVRDVLTTATVSALLDGILATTYLVAVVWASPPMGLLTAGLVFLQWMIVFLAWKRNQELMADYLSTQARSQGYLVQVLAGVETLKASAADNHAVEHWSRLFSKELTAANARDRFMATTDSLISMLQVMTPLLVLLTGSAQVLNGRLSLGVMLAMQALVGGFLAPAMTLMQTGLRLQASTVYVERIHEVLEAPVERAGGHHLRFAGQITLEEVSFRYSPLAPPLLKNISVHIEPGQFVGIVGRSGSGKSTLGRVLLGLYPPTSGRVLYDGVDSTEVDLQEIRSQFGVVIQDPYLFGVSILENLTLTDPTVPFERVVEAAKVAQIHNDIVAMPMGYETLLAEGGSSVSGGQRQRLALARALVRNPAILMLDEATSALDTITEGKVQAALASLSCTRLVIAQRLSTIKNADLILVMEDGRIVEQGSHAQLVARNGLYAQLESAQRM